MKSFDFSKTTADQKSKAVVHAVSEPEKSERSPREQVRPPLKQTEVSNSPSPAPYVRNFDDDFEPLVSAVVRVDEGEKGEPISVADSPAPYVRNFDDDFEPLVSAVVRVDEAEKGPISVADNKAARGYISPAQPPRQFYPVVRGLPMRSYETTASDTNEVHVTIGRIEITAVHSSQPSKPAPSPANKPMSLDEYLAKRNR